MDPAHPSITSARAIESKSAETVSGQSSWTPLPSAPSRDQVQIPDVFVPLSKPVCTRYPDSRFHISPNQTHSSCSASLERFAKERRHCTYDDVSAVIIFGSSVDPEIGDVPFSEQAAQRRSIPRTKALYTFFFIFHLL